MLPTKWLLVGELPTGHNGSEPLPQPGVICHLVDPGPTAHQELGIGSCALKRPHLACGQGPCSNWSALAWSCVSPALGPSSSTVLDGLISKLLTLSGKDGPRAGSLGSDLQGALKTLEAS